MKLGSTIYRMRKDKNMSQGDLAEALEVSRQSVSKWENDSAVPELDKLLKMAQIFGVSLDALVGREEASPPPPAAAEEKPVSQIVYVEKPVFPSFSGRQVGGILLLIGALLLAITLYNGRFGVAEVFLMVFPIAICGSLCLLTKHPLFYSGWMGAAAYWNLVLYPFPPLGGAALTDRPWRCSGGSNGWLLRLRPPEGHPAASRLGLGRRNTGADSADATAVGKHHAAVDYHSLSVSPGRKQRLRLKRTSIF